MDKDKALTKQYAGILTEEKVNEIYYKYGFYPYSDPDNTTIEKNFLSKYITDTFTDFPKFFLPYDPHVLAPPQNNTKMSKGRIVILSTHIVSDVEFIADEILLIK